MRAPAYQGRRATSRRSSGGRGPSVEGSQTSSPRPARSSRDPARGPPVNPIRTATVFTHRRPAETAPAIVALLEIARESGAVLRLDPEETRKHQLEPTDGLELDASVKQDVDICFALGGDG